MVLPSVLFLYSVCVVGASVGRSEMAEEVKTSDLRSNAVLDPFMSVTLAARAGEAQNSLFAIIAIGPESTYIRYVPNSLQMTLTVSWNRLTGTYPRLFDCTVQAFNGGWPMFKYDGVKCEVVNATFRTYTVRDSKAQDSNAVYILSTGSCLLMIDETSLPAPNGYAGLDSTNVALGKPATGSPGYKGSVPSHATDGILTNNYHSTDDGSVVHPYLLVDLKGPMVVYKIRVLPVAGDYANRFVDVKVLLGIDPSTGDFSKYTLVATINGPVASDQSWLEFNVSPPLCSRYIALYKYVPHTYSEYLLEVREVEAFAVTY